MMLTTRGLVAIAAGLFYYLVKRTNGLIALPGWRWGSTGLPSCRKHAVNQYTDCIRNNINNTCILKMRQQ